MRLLDLFCGRLGWSREFARRGWECVGIDLVEPPEIPEGCTFVKADILGMSFHHRFGFTLANCGETLGLFDAICASSPCEQFSVHGMKHFHPNPPYPEMGIRLFNHARSLCEASGVPYVMENVRAAQAFVGNAVHHCGPFYLWGTGVPAIMPQGIKKNWETKHHIVNGRWVGGGPGRGAWSTSQARKDGRAVVATIPPELSACVADYAERILEVIA